MDELADSPVFPESIPLGDLLATHPEYDLEKIEKHRDLYEGGSKFRKNIERYLVKRQIEKMSGAGASPSNPNVGQAMIAAGMDSAGNPLSAGRASDFRNPVQNSGAGSGPGDGQWEARRDRARYTPVVSGIVDFMLAAINQSEPAIVAASKDDSKADSPADLNTSKPADYWHNLNNDADGSGTDFPATIREILLQGMLHKRSYLQIKFPPLRTDNLRDQIAGKELDARLCVVKAENADDWEYDSAGNLIWLRAHIVTLKRAEPFQQAKIEVHSWTYFTAAALYVYTAEWEIGKKPDPKTMVNGAVRPHSLGALPIVQLKVSDALWVMERLADSAINLFNRQAAASWLLDTMAFAMMVIYTEEELSTVVASEMAALHLKPNDKCEIVSAKADTFDAQAKDAERCKDDMFLAIQAMVLIASSKDGQGRQSGTAKKRDFGALTTLLLALAAPAKDLILRAIFLLLKARDESDKVSVSLQGLDKFDVEALENKLRNCQAALSLPFPQAAKKFILQDTALAMSAGAPSDVREGIIKEIEAMEEVPTVAPPNPGGFGNASQMPPPEPNTDPTQGEAA